MISLIRDAFAAAANGDHATFAGIFHADATWNHRNDDQLGGIHRGRGGIVAFLGRSMELSGGTLKVTAESIMEDERGHVVTLMRVTATRPGGRTFDDPQVLVFGVDDGLVRSVDQYVGDPAAATEFWG